MYVILKRLHQLYFFPFSFSSFSLHIFFFFRFDINIFIILVIAVCAIYSLHSVLIIEHYSLLTSPSSTSKLPSYPPTLTFTFFQLQFNSLRYSSFYFLSTTITSPFIPFTSLRFQHLFPPLLFSSLLFHSIHGILFDFLTSGTWSNTINRLGLPPQIKYYLSCNCTPDLTFTRRKKNYNVKNERKKLN